MSLRVVVSLASFLFFASFAAAGITAPACSPSWVWSFNSLGQNLCTIAAYLISTCTSGTFTLPPIGKDQTYTPGVIHNGCVCNTVIYSLLSACDGCQGGGWFPYATYTTNCSTVTTPGGFPNLVPPGTYVPRWAIAGTSNFDPIKAAITGDTPEAGPGARIG